ncbi:MAG: carbohydrate porin [Deltaproteobacteria bacterium]|nr:carbohydrate porin [Deltaproteobacteria bacterium]
MITPRTYPILGLSIAWVLVAMRVYADPYLTPWMRGANQQWFTNWGMFDPENWLDQEKWDELEGATGGWDGQRKKLSAAGISLFGSYESETAGNPVGGLVHEVAYTHNIGLAVSLDLQKLVGFGDTYLLASASQRTGNSLSYDIPNSFAVQQLFGHQTIRLVDLAVEHRFFSKKLDVVAGRINALDDFATSPLYCFAQNLGFCGNPLSIPVNADVSSYPGAAWGIRGRYQISEEFYSMTGAYNTYRDFRSDKFHGVDFSIRHDSGVAIMKELGYSPQAMQKIGRPGIFKLGGLYDSEPRLQFDTGKMRGGTWELYVTGQEQLFHPERSIHSRRGLWGFAAFTYAPPKMNTDEYFWDGGLLYFGLIPRRPDDEIGLFGLWGQFSSDLRESQRAAGSPAQTHEAIIEANYTYHLNPAVSLQPDIQGVFRPNGTGRISDTLVLALQISVNL